MNSNYKNELRNIAKHGSISGIGILFLNLMGYVNNILITRNVGAGFYGLYVLSSKFINILILFSLLGMKMGVMRYISHYLGLKDHGKIKGVFRFCLKLVLIVSFVIFVFTFTFNHWIAEGIFHKIQMKDIIRLMSFIIPLAAVGGVMQSSMRGLKLIKLQVLTLNFISPIIRMILLLIFFHFGFKQFGLIWIHIIVNLIIFIITANFLRTKYFKFHKQEKPVYQNKEIIKFSTPLYLKNFITNAFSFLPLYLMGIYLLPREIGIYNICLKLALMVSLSLTSLNMIFSPTLSGLFARREKKLVEKLYKTTTKWILTISLIAFGILILFSKPILSIFGPAFINGTNILILLVFGDLINSGVGSVGTILLMSGRSKLVLINTIGITIVTGIFCLFLIPRYGMLGAALSRTITVILANIVRLLEVHYYENIHPYKLSFIKPIMAFGISFPVFFFGIRYFEPMSKLEFLLGVFLFLVLFSFLIWLFRLDSEDRYILKLIKNRIFSLKN